MISGVPIWTGAAGDVETGHILDLDRRREASGKWAGKIRRVFSGGFRGAVRDGGQLQQAGRQEASARKNTRGAAHRWTGKQQDRRPMAAALLQPPTPRRGRRRKQAAGETASRAGRSFTRPV